MAPHLCISVLYDVGTSVHGQLIGVGAIHFVN